MCIRDSDRRFKIKSGTRREGGVAHEVVEHGAAGDDAVRVAVIRVRGAQAPADGGRRLAEKAALHKHEEKKSRVFIPAEPAEDIEE